METIKINNYSFSKPLTCNNSGYSKWGIGTRGGKSYFVKEFLSPVYPLDDSLYSKDTKSKKLAFCRDFEKSKTDLYVAIREANDGNLVAVQQFFRVGTKYYIATDAVRGQLMSIADIARCAFADRLRLCCSIAHAMAAVHEKKIVHADIKPNNILVTREPMPRAHIIDFDSSFFEFNRPKQGEELNGDMVYLAPEAFLHIAGEAVDLSCKLDVFALGLLFCQYLCGSLPSFDSEEYQSAYESVLDDQPLRLDRIENADCRALLEKMLRKKPEERPDMSEVFRQLQGLLLRQLNREKPTPIPDTPVYVPDVRTPPVNPGNGFFMPGDL